MVAVVNAENVTRQSAVIHVTSTDAALGKNIMKLVMNAKNSRVQRLYGFVTTQFGCIIYRL
jgi:hypothetical protein